MTNNKAKMENYCYEVVNHKEYIFDCDYDDLDYCGIPYKIDYDEPTEILNVKGKVASIESVVIDGNTHYYIILDNSENIFIANINVSEKLPFIKIGDEIEAEYYEKGGVSRIRVR